MVDEEKEMSSDDLTITGDYSDYDILEEGYYFRKIQCLGHNKKRNMERKSTVNSLKQKKRIVNI